MNAITQKQLLNQLSESTAIWCDSGIADCERHINSIHTFVHCLLIGGGLGYDTAEKLADEAVAKGRSSSQVAATV